jgi:chromatin remodeling complex protein RSC6
MSRGDVVKALHDYFKAHNLQDANNRSVINFDPALEAVFHRKKTTFFKLNQLLVGKLMDPKEIV